MSYPRKLRRCRASVTPGLLALALLGAVLAVPGTATATTTSSPSVPVHRASVATSSTVRATAKRAVAPNPLANLVWGYKEGYVNDGLYPAYLASRGANRALLAKVAREPRAHWFGTWVPNDKIYQKMHDYIQTMTGGRSNVLVQMAIFRLTPWESCNRSPNADEAGSYKQWVNSAARAIGSTHVAMILQPDLPFALCLPDGPSVSTGLVSYAARVFSALPHTSVYIDAGASDWQSVGAAARLLRMAGVQYTRGFALNATHYDSTGRNVVYGAQVDQALYNMGIRGKRFVVNTAENGRPFTYQWWAPRHRGSDYNNIPACASKSSTHCVTLGATPTWNVGSPSAGLVMPKIRALAARLCDAFLWFGRPWLLGYQFSPTKSFNLGRTLRLAQTTPF